MNWNYIMAGSASTNGLLLVIAVGLMVAWKVSGWIGLDRWLPPLLGTPGTPAPSSAAVATTRTTMTPGESAPASASSDRRIRWSTPDP